MNVPLIEHDADLTLTGASDVGLLLGHIGHETERGTPGRAIGFRLRRAPTEAELDEEEWRLP